ncbi:uncharacterized protein DSM5745_04343 [Aspergillus mulundensis]|uniref:Uncharacterized protein n=1 Tax=Aspergillus mulundensis TaxID=1810919 RepID=A0A3D8SCD9_9EURO|nr:hypothetical protein DSM5745_04343 [Aspergillus mulundensis]RDW84017.1 hypothetical protein DSM5745_04343 [Aspergillus mulundensis]
MPTSPTATDHPAADTPVGIAYDPVFSYQVTAGLGRYNGSYVQSLQGRKEIAPYTVVPYSLQAIVYNLVTISMHSAAGTPPPTNYSSAPVIQIDDAPSVHFDFAPGLRGRSFAAEDCTVFGALGDKSLEIVSS